MVRAMNDIRKNPKSIIPKLQAMLPKFKGKAYWTAPDFYIKTEEGSAAVREAINYLKT